MTRPANAPLGGLYGRQGGAKVSVPLSASSRDSDENVWNQRWPVVEDGIRVVLRGDPNEIRTKTFQVWFSVDLKNAQRSVGRLSKQKRCSMTGPTRSTCAAANFPRVSIAASAISFKSAFSLKERAFPN